MSGSYAAVRFGKRRGLAKSRQALINPKYSSLFSLPLSETPASASITYLLDGWFSTRRNPVSRYFGLSQFGGGVLLASSGQEPGMLLKHRRRHRAAPPSTENHSVPVSLVPQLKHLLRFLNDHKRRSLLSARNEGWGSVPRSKMAGCHAEKSVTKTSLLGPVSIPVSRHTALSLPGVHLRKC